MNGAYGEGGYGFLDRESKGYGSAGPELGLLFMSGLTFLPKAATFRDFDEAGLIRTRKLLSHFASYYRALSPSSF